MNTILGLTLLHETVWHTSSSDINGNNVGEFLGSRLRCASFKPNIHLFASALA